MLKTCFRISDEEMLHLTLKMTQLRVLRVLMLKLLSLITQEKSETVILQFWIVTPLTSPASFKNSSRKSTDDLVKRWKISQRRSNQVNPILFTQTFSSHQIFKIICCIIKAVVLVFEAQTFQNFILMFISENIDYDAQVT
jgi:hypothetical protein